MGDRQRRYLQGGFNTNVECHRYQRKGSWNCFYLNVERNKKWFVAAPYWFFHASGWEVVFPSFQILENRRIKCQIIKRRESSGPNTETSPPTQTASLLVKMYVLVHNKLWVGVKYTCIWKIIWYFETRSRCFKPHPPRRLDCACTVRPAWGWRVHVPFYIS